MTGSGLYQRVIFGMLCLVLVCPVNSQKPTTGLDAHGKDEWIVNDGSLLERWKAWESVLKSNINTGIKAILPMIMESSGRVNISATCTADMLQLISGVKNLRAWAFKLLDASGKLMDGILSGTMASLGDFDQCLDTEAINERRGRNYGKVMFRGQYCAVDIRPPLPPKKYFYRIDQVVDELKNLTKEGTLMWEIVKSAHFFYMLAARLGLCVPSGCSKEDIEQIAKIVAHRSNWIVEVKRCELKEENVVTPVMIGVLVLYSTFGFLLLLGTLTDVIHYYKKRKVTHRGLRLICCFSLMSNFKKLVNTKNVSSQQHCLNGMRFLAISWIVLAHTYLNINYQIFRGLSRVTEYRKDFAFQAIVNAAVSVDTFFFMSGLLLCYSTMKVVRDGKNPFHLGIYLLHRYLRIAPIYIFVIAFMFLGPLLGSGPIWHDTADKYIDYCQQNWWTNLLFVNNFVNAEKMCIPQSWYVACDMQLYVYALVILLPLLRWPKIGLSISSLSILASMIISAAITYVNSFPPTMLFVHPDEQQRIMYWASLYFKPYPHAGPYCVGMMIGYLLATKPTLRMSMATRTVGWTAAIVSNMAVLYGVYGWNKGEDPTVWETMLYSGCHRVGWAVGLSWIVVCSFYGYGGIVNYILSWNAWIPLSRLTYAVYLIHPIVQMMVLGNVRMRVQTSHYFAVWIFFGHIMSTVGTAFVGSMLVEAPILSLEKIWLEKRAPQDRSATNGRPLPTGVENGALDCRESKLKNWDSKDMTVSRL